MNLCITQLAAHGPKIEKLETDGAEDLRETQDKVKELIKKKAQIAELCRDAVDDREPLLGVGEDPGEEKGQGTMKNPCVKAIKGVQDVLKDVIKDEGSDGALYEGSKCGRRLAVYFFAALASFGVFGLWVPPLFEATLGRKWALVVSSVIVGFLFLYAIEYIHTKVRNTTGAIPKLTTHKKKVEQHVAAFKKDCNKILARVIDQVDRYDADRNIPLRRRLIIKANRRIHRWLEPLLP